jgi:hypothetical protein
MNSQRFCWWLRGAYDLTPNFDPQLQRETILKHLDMVFANQGTDDHTGVEFYFCIYLEDVLLSNGITTQVQKTLTSLFKEAKIELGLDSISFCYWLQGAYELTSNLEIPNTVALTIMLSMLSAVLDPNKSGEDKDTNSYYFCIFLNAVIESEGDLRVVEYNLNQVFYHQIDKEYPNQEELSAIHNSPEVAKISDRAIDGEKLREVVGGYKPRKFLDEDEDEDSLDNIIFQC